MNFQVHLIQHNPLIEQELLYLLPVIPRHLYHLPARVMIILLYTPIAVHYLLPMLQNLVQVEYLGYPRDCGHVLPPLPLDHSDVNILLVLHPEHVILVVVVAVHMSQLFDYYYQPLFVDIIYTSLHLSILYYPIQYNIFYQQLVSSFRMTSLVPDTEPQTLKHTTLPREILKWIQGLDLSYSVKDFRKDLKNGFLVAEIFSRYHPGRIQMHSFDNSHNSERKRNNWHLISLFLAKNQITISNKEFDRVEHGDSEQLYQFMCRVYTTLTQRKLSLQPLLDNNNQTIRNDNLTSSFLMKPAGIQKLEGSINNSLFEEEEREETLQKESQNNQVKKPNLLKIPSKQITPNIDNSDSNVNMKSINIRQVNEKTSGEEVLDGVLSKRETASKKDPNQQEQEKSIMNYFDDIIESNLEDEVYEANRSLFDLRSSYCSNFIRKINSLDQSMVCLFFDQVLASKHGLVSKIFKYQQQIWKFHVFMKSCLHHLDSSHPGFPVLLDLLFQYVHEGQQKYLGKQYMREYWYPLIIKQIKLTSNNMKRSRIIKLLSKIAREETERKQLIIQFRETVNNIYLFMEFLSILIQAEKFQESGKSLIDIYINYANLHLFSNCKSLRAYSLKIYMKITSENFVFGLKTFKPHYEELSKIEDWENMSQLLLILGILLTRITESKEYLNLIKQPTSLSRTYNPENEKMSNQMKEEIENISNLIYACCLHPSPIVKKIALDVVVPLMDVHPVLGRTFFAIYLSKGKEERREILGESREIELVSESKTQLEVRNVGKEELLKVGVDILNAINEHYKANEDIKMDQSVEDLISLCLESVNDREIRSYYSDERVEKVLSELLGTIIEKSKPSPTKSTFAFIETLSEYYLKNDVKIRRHNQVLTECIINNLSKPGWEEFFIQRFKYLSSEYSKTFNPLIKQFVDHFKSEIINSKDIQLNELAKIINTEQRDI